MGSLPFLVQYAPDFAISVVCPTSCLSSIICVKVNLCTHCRKKVLLLDFLYWPLILPGPGLRPGESLEFVPCGFKYMQNWVQMT